ncbi:unnamed protein product [Phaedon cochleariae]|uniref:Protein-lysine N-methyltransferase PHAECO_LOCUS6718 n=1 Tax=Phaedon cochleariae TaxID=80249 RepID=A0A9N9SFR3_PHACE|nr:unnamed protein product [Phaedon cochleariae]
MSSASVEDDVPQLSAETFAALQEFYKEQEERDKECNAGIVNKSAIFEEDWQLSQFWYDDHTIEVLIDVAIKVVGFNGKIALVSCPTLYRPLREKSTNCEITLFEYDRRFAAYGEDFIFYDYKSPLGIQRDKADYYDLVIADPPFLSEECLTKTAVTVRYLTKNKIILCTGAVMADLANRLLDLKKCSFEPKHKNNLGNAFCCYSNFDMDSFL